jgi:hypothetical protein
VEALQQAEGDLQQGAGAADIELALSHCEEEHLCASMWEINTDAHKGGSEGMEACSRGRQAARSGNVTVCLFTSAGQ